MFALRMAAAATVFQSAKSDGTCASSTISKSAPLQPAASESSIPVNTHTEWPIHAEP